jgi:site-specific recombinase XerC
LPRPRHLIRGASGPTNAPRHEPLRRQPRRCLARVLAPIHKALQQFFKWLMVDEEAIDQTPMLEVRQPKTPKRLIPIIRDEDTKRILETGKGRDFV